MLFNTACTHACKHTHTYTQACVPCCCGRTVEAAPRLDADGDATRAPAATGYTASSGPCILLPGELLQALCTSDWSPQALCAAGESLQALCATAGKALQALCATAGESLQALCNAGRGPLVGNTTVCNDLARPVGLFNFNFASLINSLVSQEMLHGTSDGWSIASYAERLLTSALSSHSASHLAG